MEKQRQKNELINMAFPDLDECFDRIPHELMWLVLVSHEVAKGYTAL